MGRFSCGGCREESSQEGSAGCGTDPKAPSYCVEASARSLPWWAVWLWRSIPLQPPTAKSEKDQEGRWVMSVEQWLVIKKKLIIWDHVNNFYVITKYTLEVTHLVKDTRAHISLRKQTKRLATAALKLLRRQHSDSRHSLQVMPLWPSHDLVQSLPMTLLSWPQRWTQPSIRPTATIPVNMRWPHRCCRRSEEGKAARWAKQKGETFKSA